MSILIGMRRKGSACFTGCSWKESRICAKRQAGHHIAIIGFVRVRIDKQHSALLISLDRLRRKWNLAFYGDAGFVSRHDAEEALEAAREYLSVIHAGVEGAKPTPVRGRKETVLATLIV